MVPGAESNRRHCDLAHSPKDPAPLGEGFFGHQTKLPFRNCRNAYSIEVLVRWSGRRESTPRMQLGKLDVSQAYQALSCKTADNSPQSDQRVRGEKQNFSHA